MVRGRAWPRRSEGLPLSGIRARSPRAHRLSFRRGKGPSDYPSERSPPLGWLASHRLDHRPFRPRVAPRRSGGRNPVASGPVPDLGRERRPSRASRPLAPRGPARCLRASAIRVLAVASSPCRRSPPIPRAPRGDSRRLLRASSGSSPSGPASAPEPAFTPLSTGSFPASISSAFPRGSPSSPFSRSRYSPASARSACAAGFPRFSSFFSWSSRRSLWTRDRTRSRPLRWTRRSPRWSRVRSLRLPDSGSARHHRAASRHSLYMLHSTVHFLPLVNGYSGFTPERHDRLFRALASFPVGDRTYRSSKRFPSATRSCTGADTTKRSGRRVLERIARFPIGSASKELSRKDGSTSWLFEIHEIVDRQKLHDLEALSTPRGSVP